MTPGRLGFGKSSPSQIRRLFYHSPYFNVIFGRVTREIEQGTMQFKVEGLDCAEEVAVLKRELGPLVGGEDRLTFDLLNGRLTVSTDPTSAGSTAVTSEAVIRAVARTGMTAEVWRAGPRMTPQETFWQRRGRALTTVASGLCTLAGFAAHVGISGNISEAVGSERLGEIRGVPPAAQALYSLGILAGAWFVLPRAWLAIRRLRPDMNFLMTVAVLGAVGLGDWFEASTVTCLFSLSLWLEKWSVGHVRRAVESLLDLTPPVARLLRPDGTQVEVPPNQVPVGAVLLVKPAERFPLDGRVLQGSSHVNQAPITGESLPVAKTSGDPVFAGTVNGEGALEVVSTTPAEKTTLAHIIHLVAEAQSRRAPSEQWVEKFAEVYTPVVLVLTAAIFLLPPLLLGGGWSEWFYRALVLLVIACPCALVISTPVTIVAALAAAARQGVLVKGGVHLEASARMQAIAFDKTGTLTQGRPTVVALTPLSGHSERELLERAAALGARSEHPLGKAILAYARQREANGPSVEDFQVVSGKGVTARRDGRRFWLGSYRYLTERGEETEAVRSAWETMALTGCSVVIVGNESHVCGLIGLADVLRPAARETLHALRKLGVKQIVLLTGDNRVTAEVIGKAVNVDEVYAELLPADKVVAIETLVSRYGEVGMIGDGVNDAPAMARATVGIAMGAIGSDAAIETADIALMSDDLTRLPWLISHSRRTIAVIRQNIGVSLSVKMLFVILTVLGHASLWAAIAADMGASLLVIFNGLRLLNAADTAAAISAGPAPGAEPLD